MNKEKDLQEEVNKTMKSLDGIERAKTDPYFYSRLSERMEHARQYDMEPETSWSFGFSLSVAIFLLVISINLLSIAQYQQEFMPEETNRQEIIDELAGEFTIFDFSYYEETVIEE